MEESALMEEAIKYAKRMICRTYIVVKTYVLSIENVDITYSDEMLAIENIMIGCNNDVRKEHQEMVLNNVKQIVANLVSKYIKNVIE